MNTYSFGPRGRTLGLTVPGLGRLLRDEARAVDIRASRIRTTDRRSDVVALGARWQNAARLSCVEDVCVDLGTITVRGSARATAAQLDPRGLSRAIRDVAPDRSPRSVSLRPVVRLTGERNFRRTELRDAVSHHLHSRTSRAPDSLELWLIETNDRQMRVGIRVIEVSKRQPRTAERTGALRPVVAAAMIHLAGVDEGPLLDPCCGTGTILIQAARRNLIAAGGDLDPEAVDAARQNGAARVIRLDARRLPLPANTMRAVVTNLPFGHQHSVQGSPVAWYRRTLQEAIRVGPVVVVLMPPTRPFRQALGRLPVTLTHNVPITLLGRKTTIWRIET